MSGRACVICRMPAVAAARGVLTAALVAFLGLRLRPATSVELSRSRCPPAEL